MDNARSNLESELRRRISRLLDDGAQWKMHRAELLDRLTSQQAYLFGGTVRDIMVHSPHHHFRDIDIVICDTSTDMLLAEFGELVARRTRFGGLRLDASGWLFDVWPLQDTWALQQHPLFLPEDPQTLPRTTFLTIEAIAVSLRGKRGYPREIFDHGFFETLQTKTIELNYECNPYPVLNSVRAILTARRLGFSIGPRLLRFIGAHVLGLDIDELIEVQRQHYGRAALRDKELVGIIDQVRNALHWHPSAAMRVSKQSQMRFDWVDDEQVEYGRRRPTASKANSPMD